MLNNDKIAPFLKSIEEKCSYGYFQFPIIMTQKKELSENFRQRLVRAHSEGKGYMQGHFKAALCPRGNRPANNQQIQYVQHSQKPQWAWQEA